MTYSDSDRALFFPDCPPALVGPADCARLRAHLHYAEKPRYWRELASHARLMGEFAYAATCDHIAEVIR